jgi:hypothetical protein
MLTSYISVALMYLVSHTHNNLDAYMDFATSTAPSESGASQTNGHDAVNSPDDHRSVLPIRNGGHADVSPANGHVVVPTSGHTDTPNVNHDTPTDTISSQKPNGLPNTNLNEGSASNNPTHETSKSPTLSTSPHPPTPIILSSFYQAGITRQATAHTILSKHATSSPSYLADYAYTLALHRTPLASHAPSIARP